MRLKTFLQQTHRLSLACAVALTLPAPNPTRSLLLKQTIAPTETSALLLKPLSMKNGSHPFGFLFPFRQYAVSGWPGVMMFADFSEFIDTQHPSERLSIAVRDQIKTILQRMSLQWLKEKIPASEKDAHNYLKVHADLIQQFIKRLDDEIFPSDSTAPKKLLSLLEEIEDALQIQNNILELAITKSDGIERIMFFIELIYFQNALEELASIETSIGNIADGLDSPIQRHVQEFTDTSRALANQVIQSLTSLAENLEGSSERTLLHEFLIHEYDDSIMNLFSGELRTDNPFAEISNSSSPIYLLLQRLGRLVRMERQYFPDDSRTHYFSALANTLDALERSLGRVPGWHSALRPPEEMPVKPYDLKTWDPPTGLVQSSPWAFLAAVVVVWWNLIFPAPPSPSALISAA